MDIRRTQMFRDINGAEAILGCSIDTASCARFTPTAFCWLMWRWDMLMTPLFFVCGNEYSRWRKIFVVPYTWQLPPDAPAPYKSLSGGRYCFQFRVTERARFRRTAYWLRDSGFVFVTHKTLLQRTRELSLNRP